MKTTRTHWLTLLGLFLTIMGMLTSNTFEVLLGLLMLLLALFDARRKGVTEQDKQPETNLDDSPQP